MSRDIREFGLGDIAEVGRFLVEGFGTANGGFASKDVLTWKYFDPRGGSEGMRGFVAREEGRVVGFVGICPGTFHVAGDVGREVSTLHMVDWLAEKGQGNVGAYLFLRSHRQGETAYVLGASVDARRVIAGGGYVERAGVPVFRKTLRLGHRLRVPGGIGGAARLVRDAVETVTRPRRRVAAPVTLKRVDVFDHQIDAILQACEPGLVFSRRRPDLLNHLLRYPGKTLTGWMIERDGRTLGFALLAVIPSGRIRVGKVVDCFLPGRDAGDWHAAIDALTTELKAQGADVALACGSTDWSAEALGTAGYRRAYSLAFWLRDKRGLLPRHVPFHLTWIEADYAYLA